MNDGGDAQSSAAIRVQSTADGTVLRENDLSETPGGIVDNVTATRNKSFRPSSVTATISAIRHLG